jgi:hypothetical protein
MAGGEERDEAVPVAPTEEEVVAIGHALVLEAQAAAKAGDVKALEALLEKHGPELINARDKDTAVRAWVRVWCMSYIHGVPAGCCKRGTEGGQASTLPLHRAP